MTNEQLLDAAEAHVSAFFEEKIDKKFTFHNLEHTAQVVAAVRTMGKDYGLDDREWLICELAGWFHDTGYFAGSEGHEGRSVEVATAFFQGKNVDSDLIHEVMNCIRATIFPQQPTTFLEKIVCDADLAHLGMKQYWERTSRLRQEYALTRGLILNDADWVERELNFLMRHEFHTPVAREQFAKRKEKNIEQLLKQRSRLKPGKGENDEKSPKNPDALTKMLHESEDEIKQARLGRGVETMYRTTYRTHTNLSQMADSKANIMLSVNAIVLSILVSSLLPRLKSEPQIILPTCLLILTCLGSMIFATLATRPKVTEGLLTREDIKQKKGNLLFFGNYFNMSLPDFQWGVNELIRDTDYLYNSMSRDLYFLGVVLAKKYKHLSWCYNIFMWGLIVSILAFAWVYVFHPMNLSILPIQK
jgi:predicted metal-dependent HD superfamily phosphohydrolase